MSDYYKSVLQQTVESFCKITVREVERINRALTRPLSDKRLRGQEARVHYVRYFVLRRLDEGCNYSQISRELGISRRRVKQIRDKASAEPPQESKRRGRPPKNKPAS
jgi:DNA-directed RNA polymerase sigma subunit (sigma70/sigma32)